LYSTLSTLKLTRAELRTGLAGQIGVLPAVYNGRIGCEIPRVQISEAVFHHDFECEDSGVERRLVN